MSQLLESQPRPDAIFCFNDMIANGVIQCALQAKIDIPLDLAVIGCGNYHYDSMLRVPLTSIDQRTEQLGARAGQNDLRSDSGRKSSTVSSRGD